MDKINPCVDGLQHFWLPTKGKGMESYSCPMCGQLVYWTDILLEWVKPRTSGGKPIPGNQPAEQTQQKSNMRKTHNGTQAQDNKGE